MKIEFAVAEKFLFPEAGHVEVIKKIPKVSGSKNENWITLTTCKEIEKVLSCMAN
jgi:hypothetical protein